MTTTTDFGLAGGQELDRLLQTLPVKVEKNIMRASLREAAKVFLAEVKQRVPSGPTGNGNKKYGADEGSLRRSARITSRFKKGEVTASVKVGDKKAYYAKFVEFGTRPHYVAVSDIDRGPGRGKGRKGTVGRVETLASIRTVNRRVIQIGANFIGPSVHHPGVRPQPFMRPAADAATPAAIAAFQAKLRERMTTEGLNTPAPMPMDPAE